MYTSAGIFLGILVALSGMAAPNRCVAERGDVSPIQIDAAAIRQDPRLQKPVSLSGRAIPLGAVLESIASQSGIAISIDDLGPSSGYVILTECDRVQVGTVMNALFGLLSVRRGEWAWARSGITGSYAYRLRETPWASNKADLIGRMLNGTLENYIVLLRKLAPMTMAERRLHGEELQRVLLLDEPRQVEAFFSDEVFWNEARFFFGALTEDQQDSVLTGGSVSVSLKSLPPDTYDLYHKDYQFRSPAVIYGNGLSVPVPEPSEVRFRVAPPDHQAGQLAPYISLESTSGGGSWMGTGFLLSGVSEAIKRAWMLQGDSMKDSASLRIVGEVKDTPELRKDKQIAEGHSLSVRDGSLFPESSRASIAASMAAGLFLGPRLEQVAIGTQVPVLALLSPGDGYLLASPEGKPLQGFLDRIESSGLTRWYYKWRSGVLLISYPLWFTEPTPTIPYAQLRALQPDRNGQVSVANWTGFMRHITDRQADWFAATFNVSGMRELRCCLLAIANEPEIVRDYGVSVNSDAARSLRSSFHVPPALTTSDSEARMRIVTLQSGTHNPDQAALKAEVYDPATKAWSSCGIVELPEYHGWSPGISPRR